MIFCKPEKVLACVQRCRFDPLRHNTALAMAAFFAVVALVRWWRR
jgi:hypothetical protein